MKIKVTEQHIKNGTKKRADCCPIALAIKEQYPTYEPCVDGKYVKLFKIGGDYRTSYVFMNNEIVLKTKKRLNKLPPEAIRFIGEFDSSGGGKPIEFDLIYIAQ